MGASTTINTREMKKPRLGTGNQGQRSTEVEILEDGRSSVIKEEISGSEASPLPVSLVDIKPVTLPGLKELKSAETEREGER